MEKQPFSENRVQIGASVRLEFCSQEVPDTQTDTQTNRSENITPPRFRRSVTKYKSYWNKSLLWVLTLYFCLQFLISKKSISIRYIFLFWWIMKGRHIFKVRLVFLRTKDVIEMSNQCCGTESVIAFCRFCLSQSCEKPISSNPSLPNCMVTIIPLLSRTFLYLLSPKMFRSHLFSNN